MVKLIAMYLPQFHRIPENDKWWGEGFTEWVNVKKAKPLYRNHLQPRVPLNKEYYSLENKETLKRQMRMAKKFGVDGFCFYHYWFKGKKLLEKPVERLLEDEKDVLPFCLCWANESWTKNWTGVSTEKCIMIEQRYGEEEQWKQHFEYLKQFFFHKKYIKKDGKPIFIIYKACEIEKRKEMFSLWDELARKEGFPGIFIINIYRSVISREVPFVGDGVMDFEPFATLERIRMGEIHNMTNVHLGENFSNKNKCYETIDYEKFCEYLVNRYIFREKEHYLGFFAGWDNTPRLGNSTEVIFENNTPDIFEKYLSIQFQKSIQYQKEFLFINAWNEWGEGTFLEPDEKFKDGYLRAIYSVKRRYT